MSAAFAQGSVHVVAPADGASVAQNVAVEARVTGMTAEPAGELNETSDHRHTIVDGSSVAAGELLPADETHVHFGNGRTKTTLTLVLGTDTWQVVGCSLPTVCIARTGPE